MRRAIEYDRAVGYFRSAAFIIAWPALREFVAHGGRIRILCSQVLSPEDIAALDAGYAARVDGIIAARLRDEVATLLEDETMSEPARVLAALVATDVVEIKIAVLRSIPGAATTRIFHDKLGILRDTEGSVVVFKGSMNETWSGRSEDGNLESVDVACSWLGGRDQERTNEETVYFAELWTNTYPGLDVRPFPETARETLVSAADPDWESTVSACCGSVPMPRPRRTRWRQMLGDGRSSPISLRDSQRGAQTRATASLRLRREPGRPSLPSTLSASLSRNTTRFRSSSCLIRLCSPSGLRNSKLR